MDNIKRGATSYVEIDKDNRIVKKYVKSYSQFQVFEREVYWLKYLNEKGYEWCPKLLSVNDKSKIIVMEYVGEPITKNNAPIEWKKQLVSILEDLNKENIKHNDIKHGEILVENDKINLIDYGWASFNDDWSCKGRFRKIKKPCHIFHDSKAIERIERYLNKDS